MKKMYTKLKILPIYFVLFSLCILGVYDSANAQGHTVNGTVTSSNDGEALPGVNIMVEGSDTGTSTNIDGEYSLDVVHDDVTLLFSYIGYSTVEEPVNGRSTIDVALVMDAFEGDELVVVGYGTQRRRDVTGSVSSANVGEMQSIAVPRVSQALQGQVAGVQVVNTQKEPGGTVSMRIRGQNSINGNNNPLVVIDGIIGGNLNMVNTEDIETLDVLKDASATAIYGSRGANGVVVITTKRGFEGTPQINFGTSVGLQQVSKKLDLLDANGQREMLLGLPEDLRNTINVDGLLANVDPAVNTDWQDEVFQIAPMRDHNLSITGGTDQTRYAIMGSNSDQGGVVRGSGFGRTSLRVNLDQDVFEWLKVGVNLNLARTIQDNLRLNTAGGSSGGGVTDAALRMSPMVPVYNEDGSYGSSLGASPLSNPVALTNERPSQNKNNYLQGAFTTRIVLTDILIFRT
ncbi:MAG: SusC/RagA family TonB-linked outer membrane protein, partial [Balneolales bacterium]